MNQQSQNTFPKNEAGRGAGYTYFNLACKQPRIALKRGRVSIPKLPCLRCGGAAAGAAVGALSSAVKETGCRAEPLEQRGPKAWGALLSSVRALQEAVRKLIEVLKDCSSALEGNAAADPWFPLARLVLPAAGSGAAGPKEGRPYSWAGRCCARSAFCWG